LVLGAIRIGVLAAIISLDLSLLRGSELELAPAPQGIAMGSGRQTQQDGGISQFHGRAG
jgi:hypothetical protein